jgi:hypothetical protein
VQLSIIADGAAVVLCVVHGIGGLGSPLMPAYLGGVVLFHVCCELCVGMLKRLLMPSDPRGVVLVCAAVAVAMHSLHRDCIVSECAARKLACGCVWHGLVSFMPGLLAGCHIISATCWVWYRESCMWSGCYSSSMKRRRVH